MSNSYKPADNSIIMEELNKIRKLYKLKNVDRMNSVGKRKESSAEHSWSCLILADYFLSKGNIKADRLRVFELLIWHDIVEIEAGDVPLGDNLRHPEKSNAGRQEKEMAAMRKLEKDMPLALGKKAALLFHEFEECRTMEARFARAIDQLDAVLHEMDYKEDWKGWNSKFLREKKGKYFEGLPEIKTAFETLLKYAEGEGYFSQ